MESEGKEWPDLLESGMVLVEVSNDPSLEPFEEQVDGAKGQEQSKGEREHVRCIALQCRLEPGDLPCPPCHFHPEEPTRSQAAPLRAFAGSG
jgi:hypothetical protein